jgi:general secretion pathway protein F
MVKEGAPLNVALREHPKVFPELYISMVKAGESSGTLDIVFARLADFIEAQVRLRSKVTGVLVYPIIMICVAVSILMLLMIFVIPKVTEMFEEMGAQLPIQTRILIGISEFVGSWFFWLVCVPALVAGVIWFRRYISKDEKGIHWWDRRKLTFPIFGNLIRMIAVSRFARTLSTLLKSGVPLLASLDIVKAIVNNSVLAQAIESARESIKEGESIAAPLERSRQFPPMVTHMVSIGERSGELEEMLGHVADTYETQVDTRVSMLTSVLEPVLIVCMGIMVGLMVFSILMPMLKMNEVLTR